MKHRKHYSGSFGTWMVMCFAGMAFAVLVSSFFWFACWLASCP